MVIALDPKVGLPVVLESEKDLPKSEQTTFFMLPLRQGQASLVDEMQGKIPKAEVLVGLAIENIVGWENFKDSNNREIAFTKEEARERLPLLVLVELGGKVSIGLDGEQAKNSSSLSEERGTSTHPTAPETVNSADGADPES